MFLQMVDWPVYEEDEAERLEIVAVYLTLFCAMLSLTFGSLLHLIWEAGGPFTVSSSIRKMVVLLLYAAYNFDASFGPYTKYYVFNIDQVLLTGSSIGIVTFWFGVLLTRERRESYISCLVYYCTLVVSNFVVNAFDVLDCDTAHWVLKVYAVHASFKRYLVIYSQEILYNTRFGEIDFDSCTFNVFFHLPGVSCSLLGYADCYLRILLALDLGSGRTVHNPFLCSKYTLALLTSPLRMREDHTLDDCCLFIRCFCWHFHQIFLQNLSRTYALLILLTGYLVIYSQEILYNALYGDVNFVNCTFTVFLLLSSYSGSCCKTTAGSKN